MCPAGRVSLAIAISVASHNFFTIFGANPLDQSRLCRDIEATTRPHGNSAAVAASFFAGRDLSRYEIASLEAVNDAPALRRLGPWEPILIYEAALSVAMSCSFNA